MNNLLPMENAIAVLRQTTEYAESFENRISTSYYKSSLANARSILSFWDNPPMSKNIFTSYTPNDIYRAEWNLVKSMEIDV